MTQIKRLGRSGCGRFLAVVLLTGLLVFVPALSAAATDPENVRAAVHFGGGDDDKTLGASLRLVDNVWLALSLDHLGAADGPTYSLSGLYQVPQKFLFLNLYGGLGLHGSGTGQAAAHVIGGAWFWIVFWETEYSLQSGEDSLHRTGFRVAF